jgi:hypothetical protein
MSLGFQDRSMYPSSGPYSLRIVNQLTRSLSAVYTRIAKS